MIWLQKSGVIADAFEWFRPLKEDGPFPSKLRTISLAIAVSAVRGDREGEAAGLVASLNINLPL
jgi:hypothetical protein